VHFYVYMYACMYAVWFAYKLYVADRRSGDNVPGDPGTVPVVTVEPSSERGRV